MLTDSLLRKTVRLCVAISVAFTVCFVWLAGEYTNATVLQTQKQFYFLVSDSSHVEASVYATQSLGGAGFLLFFENKEYATYSVYTDEESSERALLRVQEKCDDAVLLNVSANDIRLTGARKTRAAIYRSAFTCLYAQIRLFNEESARIDDGITQESIKRFLRIQERQFAYMERAYCEDFPAFSAICHTMSEGLRDMSEGTIYAKQMRYATCYLCDSYVKLASKVSFGKKIVNL